MGAECPVTRPCPRSTPFPAHRHGHATLATLRNTKPPLRGWACIRTVSMGLRAGSREARNGNVAKAGDRRHAACQQWWACARPATKRAQRDFHPWARFRCTDMLGMGFLRPPLPEREGARKPPLSLSQIRGRQAPRLPSASRSPPLGPSRPWRCARRAFRRQCAARPSGQRSEPRP